MMMMMIMIIIIGTDIDDISVNVKCRGFLKLYCTSYFVLRVMKRD